MPGLDDGDDSNMQLGSNFDGEHAELPQEQQSGLDYVLEWNKRVSEEHELGDQRIDLDPMDSFEIQNLSASPRRFLGPPKTVGEASSARDTDDGRLDAMVSMYGRAANRKEFT